MSSSYWLFWAVLSAFCAMYGALHHMAFVMVWNVAWLVLYGYLFIKAQEAGR